MQGPDRTFIRRVAGLMLGSALVASALPSSTVAATGEVASLPRCVGLRGDDGGGDISTPWQAVLDEEGAVTGHGLTLRHAGEEIPVHTGPRGFMLAAGAERLLIGQRSMGGTRLDMIDTAHACREWTRQLDSLLYPGEARDDEAASDALRLNIHDRASRRYEGTALLDPQSGITRRTVEEPCVEACLPTDGGVTLAALEPAGAAQPTPQFGAGGWPKDKQLTFRWKSGAAPPTWARSPLKAGAEDARRSSGARSPLFVFSSGADNAVAYTGSLPGFCSGSAIACAARSMPTFWGVWIRPHGTDFAWGTLRWCQKTSSSSNCFDIRRVMLHELGHVAGLNHPSSAGFTLSAGDSVMQGITPMRPEAGASHHAYGRCDVATLQELYDTPDNQTAISTCNDVATWLGLSASATTIKRGSSVTLTARLTVDDRSEYQQLRANPLNGRSVQLKYRRAGSSDAWTTVWMRPLYQQGRYEVVVAPRVAWEFKAVFPRPGNEGLRYSRSPLRKVRVTR